MHNIILSPFSLDELSANLLSLFEQALDKRFEQYTAPKSDEILSRKQAAEVLGISLPTLNEWTKEGIVKGYRINSRVRYKRSELDDALIQVKSVRHR